MHNPFSPLVPHSAPAAALLLILPLLLTDTDSAMAAADCGPAGSFSTPQERHAARVRLLTGGRAPSFTQSQPTRRSSARSSSAGPTR